MLKRGQIGLYIIIAVLMLSAFGYGFYYLMHSKTTEGGIATLTRGMSLDAQANVVRNYVQDCLEKRTKEGIDYYGLKTSSAGLISKYIDNGMDSCVDYAGFKRAGVNLEHGKARSAVEISNDAVLVSLSYAININNQGGSSHLESFQYNLARTVSGTVDSGSQAATTQTADREIKLLAEDSDAELTIPQGTIIEGLVGDGKVSIKIMDKNFNGLQNAVVIGRVAYDGQPEGATFDPSIKLTIRIKKGDVPVQYAPSDLKIAWYDSSTGIWRTYKQLPMTEDDNYFYYSAEIEHFTPIAVVACGQTNKPPFRLRMYQAYLSPVQPISSATPQALTWTAGSGDLADAKYLAGAEIEKAHCVFLEKAAEQPAVSTSGAATLTSAGWGSLNTNGTRLPTPAGRLYNIEKATDPAAFPQPAAPPKVTMDEALKMCEFMIRDWDQDDTKTDVYTYEITDATASKPVTTPSADDTTGCLTVCKGDDKIGAQGKLMAFLTSAPVQEKIDVIKQEASAGEGVGVLKAFITGSTLTGDDGAGDGIRNGAKLMCDRTGAAAPYTYKCTSPGLKDITSWADIKSSDFYATPRTYGFSKTTDKTLSETHPTDWALYPADWALYTPAEEVGGYGEFVFELKGVGNSCADDQGGSPTTSAVPASVQLFNPVFTPTSGNDCAGAPLTGGATAPTSCGGDTAIGKFDGSTDIIIAAGDGVSCSTGDKCIWTLNNPSVFITPYDGTAPTSADKNKPRAGTNVVGVWVENSGTDANAFANAVMDFTGTGVIGQEDCETTIQDRINYLCGCNGNCPWSNQQILPEMNCLIKNRNSNNPSTYKIQLCNIADKCPGFNFETGRTVGGICSLCPTGQVIDSTGASVAIPAISKGANGKCRMCPGMMTSFDNGCLCGSNVFDSATQSNSNGAAYCCSGQIVKDTGSAAGCWQTSPLALVPAASAPIPNGVSSGTACADAGGNKLSTCSMDAPICCMVDPNKDTEYTCHKKTECTAEPGYVIPEGMAECDTTSPDLTSVLTEGDCSCGGVAISTVTRPAGGKLVCCDFGTSKSIRFDPAQCPQGAGTVTTPGDSCAKYGVCRASCGTLLIDITTVGVTNPCKDMKCCLDKSKADEVCCSKGTTVGMEPISTCLATADSTIDPYTPKEFCGIDTTKCCVKDTLVCNTVAPDSEECMIGFTPTQGSVCNQPRSAGCGGSGGVTGQHCADKDGSNIVNCPLTAPVCCKPSITADVEFTCQAAKSNCGAAPAILDAGSPICSTSTDLTGYLADKKCFCGTTTLLDSASPNKVCCDMGSGNLEPKQKVADCPGSVNNGDPCLTLAPTVYANCYPACLNSADDISSNLLVNPCGVTLSGTQLKCCKGLAITPNICCVISGVKSVLSGTACISQHGQIDPATTLDHCGGGCCIVNGGPLCYDKIGPDKVTSITQCTTLQTTFTNLGNGNTVLYKPSGCSNCFEFTNVQPSVPSPSCDGKSGLGWIRPYKVGTFPVGWWTCHSGVSDEIDYCAADNNWNHEHCSVDCFDENNGIAYCDPKDPVAGGCSSRTKLTKWNTGCECGSGAPYNGLTDEYCCNNAACTDRILTTDIADCKYETCTPPPSGTTPAPTATCTGAGEDDSNGCCIAGYQPDMDGSTRKKCTAYNTGDEFDLGLSSGVMRCNKKAPSASIYCDSNGDSCINLCTSGFGCVYDRCAVDYGTCNTGYSLYPSSTTAKKCSDLDPVLGTDTDCRNSPTTSGKASFYCNTNGYSCYQDCSVSNGCVHGNCA